MKKCKKCGAPLEGFLYNTIGKLMGIKPSESDPEICNKCVTEKGGQEASATEVETPEVVVPMEEKKEEAAPVEDVSPVTPEAPAADVAAPSEEEKKEEPNV